MNLTLNFPIFGGVNFEFDSEISEFLEESMSNLTPFFLRKNSFLGYFFKFSSQDAFFKGHKIAGGGGAHGKHFFDER